MSEQLYKTDTNAVLRFYEEASKNNFLSERNGYPVYDTVLMVEVITPGQTATNLTVEVERVLNEAAGLDEDGKRKVKRSSHYNRYKSQIEAFKGDTGEHLDNGTPITSWAMVDKGTAQTLKANGIHTIEAFASVSDSALQNLGTGARTLRDQAKSWLNSRQFGVPDAQNTAELNKLREENAALKEEVASLKAALNAYKAEGEPESPPQAEAAPALV